jgi:hypothetical protein
MPLDFSGFEQRKPLSQILTIPKDVQSVYSLTQHVWAGKDEEGRRESKRLNRVRLETLDELLVDPVRGYLNRILEKVADKEGQGWWLQAEFGVGKSHLLAATAILAIGGEAAWDHIKKREDEEKKAGPGARLDTLWRKKMEKRKLFPIVFSLEGVGGSAESRLEDFILEEAQQTFALREGKPLAVYPEEHLANLYLKEHQKTFKDDLRTFLADKRLMRGLPEYEYEALMKALKNPQSQRDAGRLLLAFYKHRNLEPRVPVQRGERLARMVTDILETGYEGIFIAIDEMSEYLRRRAANNAEDEDCLLVLSNKLAKVDAKPVWTLVAAQMSHTNPQKIIAPDRLSQEILEHKPERFRDIVVQRTRKLDDPKEVKRYYQGYRNLIPWVKDATEEAFESAFPFPPDALGIMRNISAQLTGTRSTIGFLHRALKKAVQEGAKELVPLWRVFDDLMSYSETPSTASSGTISIKSRFREEVAALESAQSTLKRIKDGQLARPQNRTRAERILNTLFLYHLAGINGLDKHQILDTVCDLKPGEDELESQLAHYEVILEEMASRLRNQIRVNQGRYEFVKRETSQYDDLLYEEVEHLRKDPQLLSQWTDRLLTLTREGVNNQFSDFVSDVESNRKPLKIDDWHGQERTGRVMAADLSRSRHQNLEIDTHSSEDDFLVVVSKRPLAEKEIEKWLTREKAADPRLVVWAPAQTSEDDRAQLAEVLAKLKISEEKRDSAYGKQAGSDFKASAHRGYTVLQGLYNRGVARSSRGSINITAVGGVEGTLASMAKDAMDTCYRSREIDFGSRKFDTPSAVKLINGLVKRGVAVSEGDALWSAVENFAPSMGLVRKDSPKRLEPSGSAFYKEIREKIEERGNLGIDVKTVYNWFTGYNSTDGEESVGLTRRMVDVYLLTLAQQGIIRISQSKGGWIDRATISNIEFKPDTLRGLARIELPRGLDAWHVFHPYLEILTSMEGKLGPKYDKATADDALRFFWESKWIEKKNVDGTDTEIREVFEALGQHEKHPFDELLIFWIQFSDENRPEPFSDEEVYQWLQRAVLKVAQVNEIDDLNAAHLSRFRDYFRQWSQLRASFDKTSAMLLRAARLSSAEIPTSKKYEYIANLQNTVRSELAECEQMILNPERVNSRLAPRLTSLEEPFLEGFLADLGALENAQRQLNDAAANVSKSVDTQILRDFADDLSQAKDLLDQVTAAASEVPRALRSMPEDTDRAERDIKREAKLKDLDKRELSWARLFNELELRIRGSLDLNKKPDTALSEFAAFLSSPGVKEALAALDPVPPQAQVIKGADNSKEIINSLRKMSPGDRQALAKILRNALGKRREKVLLLSSFNPSTQLIWEKSDIERVVKEFEKFITDAWQDDTYLKIR